VRPGQDIAQSYKLGANSYFIKPVRRDALIEMVQSLNAYGNTTLRVYGRSGFRRRFQKRTPRWGGLGGRIWGMIWRARRRAGFTSPGFLY